MNARNPITGKIISLQEVSKQIIQWSFGKNPYIVIGSDSQRRGRNFKFVTVICCIDIGHGGYFYIINNIRQPHRSFKSWKNLIAWKVWEQAIDIHNIASALISYGVNPSMITQTHHDLSKNGLSGQHISGITGMMKSYGYHPKIKPDAWAASGIANAFTKR